uniref:GRAM domain-containing protein n=1 Tax=Taeniopygia guttata TaxID=59729 RepID=A0A674HSA1_TAEGU
MAGTPPTVPGCSKPCPAWPWALPGIQGGHPVPGPAHPAREQFLPNLPSIPALWQWEPFPVSCPSRPCPQSLSSSPGAPSGPARGSELSLELLLSRGAPPALPAWLQGRGSPCPVPAHSAPCVPLGGLWLWGSHGGSGAVCGLRGVQGAGLGLPTDLPRPPGPARCPSSGGGGGGGRGGGGSGAGTALEAAAAGQLRRDGGPAVPPSRNRPFPQAVPSLPALGAIPHAGEAEAQQAGGAGGEAVAEPGGEGKCPAGASQAHQVGAAPRGGASQPHFPPVPLQSPPPMPPSRSRTYESSCKEAEQAATGRQGPPSPSLSKQDSSYRRVFGGLAEQDALLGCFSCAWQREMPYHGRLYVSSRHICFHSSLLLKDIKAVVPVASISALKKTNTALLVPNAISIRTAKGEKFLFVALRQREATYQLLRSVCKHLQDSGQSSRDSASWEETLGKSQMLSQSAPEQSTPEPNSLQEALDEPNLRSRQAEDEDGEVALLVPRSSEWVPSAKTHGLWGRPHSVLCAWATALWSWINPQLSSLNIIITIYLLLMVALLLSSGYIGLRIAELEQQLSFAGAGPDLNLSQQ